MRTCSGRARSAAVARGQARLAVAGADPVQAAVLAVAVGEEVVRQQDHALGPRLRGLGVVGRRGNLQIDRSGPGGQEKGAGQSDPARGADTDVAHGVNLRQKIGTVMGLMGGVVPIALPA